MLETRPSSGFRTPAHHHCPVIFGFHKWNAGTRPPSISDRHQRRRLRLHGKAATCGITISHVQALPRLGRSSRASLHDLSFVECEKVKRKESHSAYSLSPDVTSFWQSVAHSTGRQSERRTPTPSKIRLYRPSLTPQLHLLVAFEPRA